MKPSDRSLIQRAGHPSCWHWVGAVLLALATLAVYLPCLDGAPVWDDNSWLEKIHHLKQDLRGLGRIWTEPTAMQQYYPMTGTSFWLDEQLWGSWMLPYHVENVLLHALAAILLWRLLRALGVPGAWFAGAVFALHPVMVESAAWISERKNVLSLAFMLGGLLACVRWWERWTKRLEKPDMNFQSWLFIFQPTYLLALVLGVMALCSKITAFVFAPTLLLIAWWKRGALRWKEDVLPTLPFFAATLLLGGLVWWLENHHVGAEGKDFSASISERWITAGRAFWFYPGKLLWPLNLCFIYPDWREIPPAWHHWLWLASVPLLFAGLWLARGRAGRGPLVASLFYLGALLPVTGLLNVYGGLFAPVWDHWAYVPALGVIVLVCSGLARLAARAGAPWALRGLACVVLPLLAWQSRAQTWQYRDEKALWIETIKRNPSAWLAQNNHGAALVSEGKLEEATGFFRACLETRPHDVDAWNNLATALAQLGKYEDSLDAYRKAISFDAKLAPYIRHSMGNVLLSVGRTGDALEQFRASLAMQPDYEEARNSLGAALIQVGRLDEGIEHLERAICIKADYHQAHNNLGIALQKKGDLDGAQAAYEKSIALAPRFIEARFNLGELLYKKGGLAAATERYEEVIAIAPDHAKSHYNLGLCYTEQGKIREAEAAYRKAVAIKPAYGNAHNNLANILLKDGRIREAIDHFQRAVDADASQLAALNNLAWVLATSMEPSLRDGSKAVMLARKAAALTNGEHPMVLSTLAAALAETGAFGEAVDQAWRAHELAVKQGDRTLAASLEAYLKLYEARQPLRIERNK